MRRNTATGWLGIVLAAVLAAGLVAQPAASQGREFSGRVASVDGGGITVENRRGEKVRFTRTKKTTVDGAGGWKGISRGDRVIVQWSLKKGPRRADRVIVLGGRP